MKIRYISQGGTVDMGGGGNIISNISRINGFDMPSPNYEEVTYAGENGTTTTGKTDLPRIMTITGDFYGGQKERNKVLKAFYYPGELYCDFGKTKRKISCKCTNCDDIENYYNSGINGFTVQFQADYPYFSDYYDTMVSLASYVNRVTDTFTLPCVFTELKTYGNVENRGDMICYPVITLSTPYEPTLDTQILCISNDTTGANIKLNYRMQKDEIITVDLSTRRIDSNVSGNITNSMTDDTYLDKFYLEPGENLLRFSSSDKRQLITAYVTFNNLYLMSGR